MALVEITRGSRHIEVGEQTGEEFLHHWKSHGGEDAPQCGVAGCANCASEGGHVHQTDAAGKTEKAFIVPLCHEHNQLKTGCEFQFKLGTRGIEVHNH